MWHDDKKALEAMLHSVLNFSRERLKLELKQPVIGNSEKGGLPFLGFLVKKTGIFLLRKSKIRMIKRAAEIKSELETGLISEEQAAQRANSVNAAVLISRSRKFRVKLWQKEAVSGTNRVIRGGSWNNTATNVTVANRNNNTPTNQNNNNGFRVVRP